jgi:hypothetical protein
MDFGVGCTAAGVCSPVVPILSDKIPNGQNCPVAIPPWLTNFGGAPKTIANPVPVASATALITDIQVAEGGAGTAGYMLYFLDPYGAKNNIFGNIIAGQDAKDSEAQLVLGHGLALGARQIASYRLRMNYLGDGVMTATVYIGVDTCPTGDTYVSVAYRGYVEPVVHIPVPSF